MDDLRRTEASEKVQVRVFIHKVGDTISAQNNPDNFLVTGDEEMKCRLQET